MNRISGIVLLLIGMQASAQAPELMSFQAVVRDAGDALVANTQVGMRIAVLQGSSTGAEVYAETHTPTTNTNGLVSLEVGGGTPVVGSMAAIDWSAGPYFLRTETDPTGGTAYTVSGVQQLLSVPYALHAGNGGLPGPQGPPGPMGPTGPGPCEVIRTGEGRMVIYTATTAHGFGPNNTSGSGWYTTTLSGTLLGAIASDSSIVLYTTTGAYGFGRNLTSGSGWYTTTYAFAPMAAVASSGRIVIYGDTGARGFGFNSTSGSGWYSTTFAATPIDHVVAGNRVVVYTPSTAHGFGYNGTSGSNWYTTTLSAAPVDHIGTR